MHTEHYENEDEAYVDFIAFVDEIQLFKTDEELN
jgi:hypothetical protein